MLKKSVSMFVDGGNKEIIKTQTQISKTKAKEDIDEAKGFVLVVIKEDITSVIGAITNGSTFMEIADALNQWHKEQITTIFNKIAGDIHDKFSE